VISPVFSLKLKRNWQKPRLLSEHQTLKYKVGIKRTMGAKVKIPTFHFCQPLRGESVIVVVGG